MARSQARLLFTLVLAINCVLWSQSRYARFESPGFALSAQGLAKRAWLGSNDGLWNASSTVATSQCAPLTFPPSEQCNHVRKSCPRSDTFTQIQYLRSYYCTPVARRILSFAALVVWLCFLFSTLGISASDFFCPNLATLAQILGLDENVAGVTFLAFGNGSPDVFATFAAMRTNSASLAIGELLGAASFIVSCVVGSMCIIKPFRVDPYPFVRDVGFFTLAVALLLTTLWDGEISAMEAGSLVLLYVVYVCVVVVGTWWYNKRERRRMQEARVRAEYAEDEIPDVPYHDEEEDAYTDEPSPGPRFLSPGPLSPGRSRAISHPLPPRLSVSQLLPPRPHSRSGSPTHDTLQTSTRSLPLSSSARTPRTAHLSHMASFSLVGALEFRHLVSTLRPHASASSLSVFESPITPFAGGHYRHRPRSRTPGGGSTRGDTLDSSMELQGERDPWDAALREREEGIGERHTLEQLGATDSPAGEGSEAGDTEILDESDTATEMAGNISLSVPTLPPRVASHSNGQATKQKQDLLSRRERIRRALVGTYRVLFPTLYEFRTKTALGKLMSLFAAPAVLMLTLTLPVVVTPYDEATPVEDLSASQRHPKRLSPRQQDRLLDIAEDEAEADAEDGYARAIEAEEEVQEEMHGIGFNKWLTVAQCVFGPLFVIAILFDGVANEGWLLLAAGIAGVSAATFVACFSGPEEHPTARFARCIMGFLVAVVWIMAIADEVVNVLQTFGFIFGLSNAIIGLTIFAMGNSLADLVANTSVAVFAPIMGFSACFGGPMLNILLGVGISGSYIVEQTGKPYPLDLSATLIVSAIGLLALLLATAIAVPLNGYELTRRWGICLIACYVLIMGVNVFVEVKGFGMHS